MGTALEVEESIALLQGQGPADLLELTVELTAEMLRLAHIAPDLAGCRERVRRAIADGSGLHKLEEIIEAQHGNPGVVRDPSLLHRARQQLDVKAELAGVMQRIACEEVGLAGVQLGAGRQKTDDVLDLSVGFTLLKKVGDPVAAGEPIVRMHHNGQAAVPAVQARLRAAYRIGSSAPVKRPLILERLGD